MLEFTKEEIEVISAAAEALFSDREICLLAEIDEHAYAADMDDEQSNLYTTIMRGRLTTELALRSKIIENAKQGSSPAQSLAVRMLETEKSNRFAS